MSKEDVVLGPVSPSPLRYPGGKSWLIPTIQTWIESLEPRPTTLIEPFAGGANVGLFMLLEGKVDQLVLGELDPRLIALWETVIGDAKWLMRRVESFKTTGTNLRETLSRTTTSRREIAFQTLLRNRTSRGGIIANGSGLLKAGEHGNGVFSRWYPDTLSARIEAIHEQRHRISFFSGSAFKLIRNRIKGHRNAFFIDPPYSISESSAGRRLYDHFELNHERLFALAEKIQGHFMMTYESSREIRELAIRHQFNSRRTRMQSTHHKKMWELLITNY